MISIMSSLLSETTKYLVFPLLAPAIGGLIGLRLKPSPKTQSLIRHIAAGLVFAAAAVELLPKLLADKQPLGTIIGFAIGIGFLLFISRLSGGHYHGDADETEDHQHTNRNQKDTVTGMLTAITFDVAIDGLLIGIGFATGVRGGQLLTLAISTEALFIGMTIVASCKQLKISDFQNFILAAFPGFVLVIMAYVGVTVLSNLHSAIHQALIAFGIAALLYLVTEELLVEAHESPDEPIEVVGFFGGFLLLVILAIL
jgi:ZIP family zinc transporter